MQYLRSNGFRSSDTEERHGKGGQRDDGRGSDAAHRGTAGGVAGGGNGPFRHRAASVQVPEGRPRVVPRPKGRRLAVGRARRERGVPPVAAADSPARFALRERFPAADRPPGRPGRRRRARTLPRLRGRAGAGWPPIAGYGIFRTGTGRLPSTGTLRLLDAVGAQVAAYCECVSRGRGEEGADRLEGLARSNRDLGWLLEFGESLHSLSDPDTMFKWLARELGAIVPILGLELASLTGGPVIRVGPTSPRRYPVAGTARSSRGTGRKRSPGTTSTSRKGISGSSGSLACRSRAAGTPRRGRRTSGRSNPRCITPDA